LPKLVDVENFLDYVPGTFSIIFFDNNSILIVEAKPKQDSSFMNAVGYWLDYSSWFSTNTESNDYNISKVM
jgi:hypothetical protein